MSKEVTPFCTNCGETVPVPGRDFDVRRYIRAGMRGLIWLILATTYLLVSTPFYVAGLPIRFLFWVYELELDPDFYFIFGYRMECDYEEYQIMGMIAYLITIVVTGILWGEGILI